VIRVHLILDIYNDESGRQRAERDVDLPAVPRIGEFVAVSRMLTLRVNGITWMLKHSDNEDQRPWLWIGRSEGTTDSIKDLGAGEHEVPQVYVDDLADAGWTLTPND
jgi:hypothetical protein